MGHSTDDLTGVRDALQLLLKMGCDENAVSGGADTASSMPVPTEWEELESSPARILLSRLEERIEEEEAEEDEPGEVGHDFSGGSVGF